MFLMSEGTPEHEAEHPTLRAVEKITFLQLFCYDPRDLSQSST